MMCNATNHSIKITIMDTEQNFFINTCGSHGDGYRISLPTLWRNIPLQLQRANSKAHCLLFNLEDGGSVFLQNSRKLLPDHTMSHPTNNSL
jgi:hypothetical protein